MEGMFHDSLLNRATNTVRNWWSLDVVAVVDLRSNSTEPRIRYDQSIRGIALNLWHGCSGIRASTCDGD